MSLGSGWSEECTVHQTPMQWHPRTTGLDGATVQRKGYEMTRKKLKAPVIPVLLLVGTAWAQGLEFKEDLVAGGPADASIIRHLVMRGSNFEIGKKLAEIAGTQLHSGPIPHYDRRHTQAQLRYFQKYYPIHLERMRGAAAAFDTDLDNLEVNFGHLFYGLGSLGCSVVYYPPSTTADGRGVLSRNFDFTTGTIQGKKVLTGEISTSSNPYVIEIYPDRGYASITLCLFDLLGGAVGGINAEGLTVALLADEDVLVEVPPDPAPGPQAGLAVIQVARYLLDTCANVEEAQEALLEAKMYYLYVPCHFLIADRHGASFIWENSLIMNHGHIISGVGRPQITTNFLLHRHEDLNKLPAEEQRLGMYNRFRTLRDRIATHDGNFDKDFIKQTNRCVMNDESPPPEPYAPNRTLWHALYCPEERSVDIDFYVGEEKDPGNPKSVKIRRSGYRRFSLKH